MNPHTCLLCIDGMMPAGIDPIFGPVYRVCPCCHIPCLDCNGEGTFPAAGGYALQLLGTALYALGYKTDICRACFGNTNLWSDDHHATEDNDDTIHRVEKVLRDLADAYYATRKQYEEITASGDATDSLRAFYCAEFATFAEIGNQIADALGIAAPDWEAMRDLAKPDPWTDHTEPGVNP